MRLRIHYDPRKPTSDFIARIPPEARWKADNYNHLMEQPTLFYAVALTLALTGHGDGLPAILGWAYVVLRVAHSLVQATVNVVLLRFGLFMAGSLVLLTMTIEAAMIVFRT